jgi:predicted membrane protein
MLLDKSKCNIIMMGRLESACVFWNMHFLYAQQNCSAAILIVFMIEPRGEGSMWHVFKQKSGPPQTWSWHTISPLINKILMEALLILWTVHAEQVLSWFRVCEWCHRCRDNFESLQNYLLSACPATSWSEDNVQLVQKVVHSDYHCMVQTTGEKFGILA